MLAEFFIALPLFILSLFGVLELSELAYFQSTAEFASFAAVRGHFVDDHGLGLGRKSSERSVTELLHPLRTTPIQNSTLRMEPNTHVAEVTIHDLLFTSMIQISGKTPLAVKNGASSR